MKVDTAARPRSSLVSANSAKLDVDVTIVTMIVLVYGRLSGEPMSSVR